MRKEFEMTIQRGEWENIPKTLSVVTVWKGAEHVYKGRMFNIPASGDLTIEELERFKDTLDEAIKFAKSCLK